MIQGKVVGDLLMGTEMMKIRPFHYFKRTLKKSPRLSSKKAHPNFSSLLVLVETRLLVAKGLTVKGTLALLPGTFSVKVLQVSN